MTTGDVPVWLQAFIAFCGTFGVISTILNNYWSYRIKIETMRLHDCLDTHIEQSKTEHEAIISTVQTVAITDDARDVRNTGAKAILSGENKP